MDFIHVKNLEKYHPKYKDRKLVWCKLYFATLNYDPAFMVLDEVDKWRFFALVMLELQLGKPVPLDIKFLSMKGFDFKKRPIMLSLRMLRDLVEIRNIPLQDEECTQNVTVALHNVPLYKEDKDKEMIRTVSRPTREMVLSFFKANDCPPPEAEKFFNHYEAADWVRAGGVKVKNWEASARTWIQNFKEGKFNGSNRMGGGVARQKAKPFPVAERNGAVSQALRDLPADARTLPGNVGVQQG